ncbi:hypothetical protein MRX96_002828 [Rhipicephalus microplus]
MLSQVMTCSSCPTVPERRFDVTVMVRSILLRGFDQDMAERIGKYMEEEGIRFFRPCVPTKLELIEEGFPWKNSSHC